MARNKNTAVEEPEVDEVVEELDSDETEETEDVRKPITPAQIALATGADPKAIRGYLRANFPRTPEMKGKSWDIPAEVAAKVIERFKPQDVEDVEDDELEMIESD